MDTNPIYAYDLSDLIESSFWSCSTSQRDDMKQGRQVVDASMTLVMQVKWNLQSIFSSVHPAVC